MNNISIRTIQEEDNAVLAKIIRNSLEEFNANKPGTVYYDPTTDKLFEVFKTRGSKYFVAAENNIVLGGGGIYPTQNLPPDTCELVKLYVSNAARGKGIGRLLMEKCFAAAKQFGYTKMYLESMPELNIAVPLYEKLGFTYLPAPMGNSGHDGCDIWMIKELS
jgi:putative acetyltransferase